VALARLLEYPGDDFDERLAAAPGSGAIALAALDREEREELYTAAFDVTPACVPYASIHLFGEENFKRGEFMAALRARYAEAGFDAGDELPDHLATLLRFAAHASEAERRELVEFCLLHPLECMLEALRENHPYRAVLGDVRALLHAAYPDIEAAPSPREEMQGHGAGCRGCAAVHEHETERVPNT
jgi:nitrate reductase delta subunit